MIKHALLLCFCLFAALAFSQQQGPTQILLEDSFESRPSLNRALRFFGNGVNDIDRVKIRIDDPESNLPGPPVDIGATDFTIEFWLRAIAGENTAGAVSCGNNNGWISGNIVVDRDRFNQGRNYGLSIANRRLVWGVMTDVPFTVCGQAIVDDGQWHHIAVQRALAGQISVFVDGQLDASGVGPAGSIEYPDDGFPGNFCDGPCVNSDPYIVFGAEKHDAGPAYPSFSGWLDEVRLSTIIRYQSNFARQNHAFATDADTVGLYHFDEAAGLIVIDNSLATGGPSNGQLRVGGQPAGPLRVVSDAPTAPAP